MTEKAVRWERGAGDLDGIAVVVLDAADAADEILLLGLFFGGVRGRTAEEEGHEVWVGCFREVAG